MQGFLSCRQTGLAGSACLHDAFFTGNALAGAHKRNEQYIVRVCLGIFQSGLDKICCKAGVCIKSSGEFVIRVGINSGSCPIPQSWGHINKLGVTDVNFLQIGRCFEEVWQAI